MTSERGRWRFRPTVWATVAVIPVLIVLVGLGVWQIQRMGWKADLVDRMRARMDGPAIALPRDAGRSRDLRFRRVALTGAYLHDKAMHRVAQPHNGARGFDLITPLRLTDGRTVLVDRGWLPMRFHARDDIPAGVAVNGKVTVEGVVRFGGWSGAAWLRPENHPPANEWVWMDLAGMARNAGLANAETDVYVQAVTTAASGRWPIAGKPSVDLRRNHLGYALTWFGLAIGLAVIYIIFHLRRDDRPPHGGASTHAESEP